MISRKTALRAGQPAAPARPKPSQADKAPESTAQTRYPITGCRAALTSSSPRQNHVESVLLLAETRRGGAWDNYYEKAAPSP